MIHLLDAWEETKKRIQSHDHLALLLDFDGTLTPIVSSPDEAVLNRATANLLASLQGCPGVSVAVISGRSLADLKERVRLEGIVYAGNHGLEIEFYGAYFVEPSAEGARSLLRRAAAELEGALSSLEGCLVENKELTLSVHYRNVAPEQRALAREIVQQVAAPYTKGDKLRLRSGKMVLELIPPVERGKGAATEWILDKLSERWKTGSVLAVSVGDDLTDEDAFAAVRSRGGIAIFVGEPSRDSAASFWLRSPEEVREFLSRTLVMMEREKRQ